MKETPLANCERTFVLQALADGCRIDERQVYDYRPPSITFSVERGSCNVDLGKTRAVAQVSCEVCQPREVRPAEGLLQINLELSPMAAEHFETGRPSELSVELSRLLERCIRESNCLDMESLCIVTGEKVWLIRVDVHILNHDGNLADCACIATIAALAHFRRPDVTTDDGEIIIHSSDERDPVPLTIFHMPLACTFAWFDKGRFLLLDPTALEERVMEGKMIVGMNRHREICALHIGGKMLLVKEQVLRCTQIAAAKVNELVEVIQKALRSDEKARLEKKAIGFTKRVVTDKLTGHNVPEVNVDLTGIEEKAEELQTQKNNANKHAGNTSSQSTKPVKKLLAKGTGELAYGEGGPNTWEKTGAKPKVKGQRVRRSDDDSEEEDVIMLDDETEHFAAGDVTNPKQHSIADVKNTVKQHATKNSKKKSRK